MTRTRQGHFFSSIASLSGASGVEDHRQIVTCFASLSCASSSALPTIKLRIVAIKIEANLSHRHQFRRGRRAIKVTLAAPVLISMLFDDDRMHTQRGVQRFVLSCQRQHAAKTLVAAEMAGTIIRPTPARAARAVAGDPICREGGKSKMCGYRKKRCVTPDPQRSKLVIRLGRRNDGRLGASLGHRHRRHRPPGAGWQYAARGAAAAAGRPAAYPPLGNNGRTGARFCSPQQRR